MYLQLEDRNSGSHVSTDWLKRLRAAMASPVKARRLDVPVVLLESNKAPVALRGYVLTGGLSSEAFTVQISEQVYEGQGIEIDLGAHGKIHGKVTSVTRCHSRILSAKPLPFKVRVSVTEVIDIDKISQLL